MKPKPNSQWNKEKQAKEAIDRFIEKYRPKIIREYKENRVKVKVYESR